MASSIQTLSKRLAQCYLVDDIYHHVHQKDLSLQYPLGTRLPTHRQLQLRQYYMNNISSTIYQQTSTHYIVFHPSRNNRSTIHFQQTGHTTHLPISCYPISPTIISPSQIRIYKQQLDTNYMDTPTQTPTTFQSHIQSLDHWESQLLTQHLFLDTDATTVAANTNQPILLATDGSENSGKGSFAWILSTPQGKMLVQGSGTVFGSKISSF